MLTARFRDLACGATLRSALACASVCLCAVAAVAHDPVGVSDEEPIVGCGKGRALARQYVEDQIFRAGREEAAEAFDDTDVLHYELAIEITDIDTDAGECTITGRNRMTIRSEVEGLSEFTFRLREQYVVTGAFANNTIPVVVATDTPTTRVATLDRAYGAGEELTLTIEYSGTSVPKGWGSIDISTQDALVGGIPIVETLSEPYYSYTWWPVKDGDIGLPGDNSEKATMEFSITVPDNFTVPSNGLLQSVVPLAGNRMRFNWASSYPIAAYLVSFAATEYNVWTEDYVHPGGTMPVEFYIYPSNDNPDNREAWGKAVDMLGTFVPLFGEYPFINEKYGIYNFEFDLGMEHQTMTGQSTFDENVTAHELAHQWWGDMVSCKTWSDIWLNEGFASYSECLWREFKSGTPDPVAYRARLQARRPSSVNDSVYVYPEDLTLLRIFSPTYSYNKGCWVLHQLRHVVGDETFFEILANYRASFEFSAATTDDFAAVASATHGEDLSWFFDQWIYEIGAPAYEYGWTTVNVEGQDFLLVEIRQVQVAEYPDVFTMPVELEFFTSSRVQHTISVWNDRREQWFAIPVSGPVVLFLFDPDDWILHTSDTDVGYSGTPGDFDDDLDVDGDDFTALEQCFTGPARALEPGCEPGDFDGDEDIDCDDWGQFKLLWMAAGDPPKLVACARGIPTVSGWGMVVMTLLTLTVGTVLLRFRALTPPPVCSRAPTRR